MYEIRKDGGVIALTEKPNYIRRHADGFYILCEEEDAQGVAVDGTVYRLMGRTGLDELKEVQLIEKDTRHGFAEQQRGGGHRLCHHDREGRHRRRDGRESTRSCSARGRTRWPTPQDRSGNAAESSTNACRRTPRRGTGNRRTARRCGWASPTRRRNGRSGASRWAAQMPTPRAQR